MMTLDPRVSGPLDLEFHFVFFLLHFNAKRGDFSEGPLALGGGVWDRAVTGCLGVLYRDVPHPLGSLKAQATFP